MNEASPVPVSGPGSRDRLLLLPDEELVRLCRVERRRGTGPGGQKRNKTESSVKVTLEGTAFAGASDETRSQHSNLQLALRHLRQVLALEVRQPPAPGWTAPATVPGARQLEYFVWMARLLDLLEAHGGRVSEAAATAGLSTGRLVRELARDADLWQQINRYRHRFGLTPLKM